MSTHPSHRYTETYIAERYRDADGGHWLEVVRFPDAGNAREYVRDNTPMFSPWRIVRLRIETRSEVLEQQRTDPEGGRPVTAPADDTTLTEAEREELARICGGYALDLRDSDGSYSTEIAGVRMEKCDDYGRTVTTLRAEQAEQRHADLVAAVEALAERYAAEEANADAGAVGAAEANARVALCEWERERYVWRDARRLLRAVLADHGGAADRMRATVLAEVAAERKRQTNEEVAEALDELGDTTHLRTELVQAAAVAVQWIEAIDGRADRDGGTS